MLLQACMMTDISQPPSPTPNSQRKSHRATAGKQVSVISTQTGSRVKLMPMLSSGKHRTHKRGLRMMNLGTTVMSRGIADKVSDNEKFANQVTYFFDLFIQGDWGDVSEDDADYNDANLQMGKGYARM